MTTDPTAVLDELGVPEPDAERRDALDRDGYVVLPDVVAPPVLARIRETIAERAPATGSGARGTSHLDLLDGGPEFDAVWTEPSLLSAVRHLLGPDFRMRSLAFRGPNPGFGAQVLHTDTRLSSPPADGAHGATAIVALVDVTADGGATRVLPGSHRRHGVAVPQQPGPTHPDERSVPLAAGSALVFGVHLWHSGTANRGRYRRDALQLSYTRRGDDVHVDYPDVGNATLDRLGPAAHLLL